MLKVWKSLSWNKDFTYFAISYRQSTPQAQVVHQHTQAVDEKIRILLLKHEKVFQNNKLRHITQFNSHHKHSTLSQPYNNEYGVVVLVPWFFNTGSILARGVRNLIE